MPFSYDLLDGARLALEHQDSETAVRLAAIMLAQRPDHLEARHLFGLASYMAATGNRLSPPTPDMLVLRIESGAWHIQVGLILEKSGQTELANTAYRTAALLDFHLKPGQRAGFNGPFNGQILRMEAFRAIAASGRLGEVVETGAHRGTTTEFMARLVACPVKTTESSPYYCESTRLRFEDLRQHGCAWADNLKLYPLDTRAFLTEILQETPPAGTLSFFYLDAHCDYLAQRPVENPLVTEVRLVRAAREHAMLLIDDLVVPDDAGYTGETDITMDVLAPLLGDFDAWFFPLASRHDSGFLRGSVLLSSSPETTALLAGIDELRLAGRP